MTETELVDLRGLAELAGVKYNTARIYHQRAQDHRRKGNPRPGDLPPPDQHFSGRIPVWKRETIETWMEHRPGRGVGGGYPSTRAARSRSDNPGPTP